MERYNRVAIGLHWLIAGLIIALIPIGLLLEDIPKAYQVTVYQMHKSFGLMVLFLSLARLGWRLMNPPPPLPDGMRAWEKLSAHALHMTFYVLIIAIPITGWMMVSTSPKNIPTMFLTLFNWPHIWFLAGLAVEQKKVLVGVFHETHEILAFTIIGLLVLHIGAALKHQYINKDNAMARMLPWMGKTTPPTRKPRGVFLVFGGPIIIFAILALVGMKSTASPDTAPVAGPAADVGNWQVLSDYSNLTFAFTHAGNDQTGSFLLWNADITFEPDDLDNAKITAWVDLGSARTGDATYDSTLPEADWFDIAAFRKATFTSTEVRAVGEHNYIVDGMLSLRGISLPLSLPFTLKINGEEAHVEGITTLDRLDFGIGQSADPTAEYVGRKITISLSMSAARRPAP